MTGRGLGADDYLPKPFHFPNSSGARPASISTRCTAPSPTTGQQIQVSPKEFTVLARNADESRAGTRSAEDLLAEGVR